MSNSSLVDYTKLSPNHWGARTHKIDKITLHHAAGNASVETLGDIFADPDRNASSNYGIGSDGRVAMYLEEANHPQTSGNYDNDNRAVTIEVANDGGDPDWHVSDKALEKTIELCVDICKRNDIERLNYTGDASGNLTMHKWFEPTACPGPYLESKFPYIAEEVNKRLGSNVLYRVQVGCFRNRDNAEAYLAQVQAAGFPAFIAVDGADPEPAETKSVKQIEEGSTVRVKQGAKTYNGVQLAPFVYERDHIVSDLNGNYAVITYGGVTVASVNTNDLYLV